jgi:hypothetical protein
MFITSGPEYLQHERLTALKNGMVMPTSKNLNLELSGIHSTETGESHQRTIAVSEDELSAVSAGKNLTSTFLDFWRK